MVMKRKHQIISHADASFWFKNLTDLTLKIFHWFSYRRDMGNLIHLCPILRCFIENFEWGDFFGSKITWKSCYTRWKSKEALFQSVNYLLSAFRSMKPFSTNSILNMITSAFDWTPGLSRLESSSSFCQFQERRFLLQARWSSDYLDDISSTSNVLSEVLSEIISTMLDFGRRWAQFVDGSHKRRKAIIWGEIVFMR